MNVRIYLITDAIFSIVDTRLRLPTKTLLKVMQARMQLELFYEWLGLATFARATYTTHNNLEALVKFEIPLQR